MKKVFYLVLSIALISLFALTGCSELAGENHEHTFATEWSKDETSHWHAATCEHTSEKEDVSEHNWNSGVVTKEATCSEAGTKEYTCAVCGQTKTETLNMVAHSLVDDAKVDVTCTTDGKEAGKHCTKCEYTEGGAVIPATDHDYGDPVYTWSEDYLSCTATKTCKNDATHVISETVTTTYAVVTNPQCEVDGTGKYTATFTNSEFTNQEHEETIDALVHDYKTTVSYAHLNDGYYELTTVCNHDETDKTVEKVYINVYDLIAHINTTKPFNAGDSTSYAFDASTKTVTINKMSVSTNQWCRFDFVRNSETSFKYAYVVIKGNNAGLCIGAKVDTNEDGSIINNKYNDTANNKQYKGVGEDTIVIIWDLETLGINSKELAKVVFWPYSKESTTGSFQIVGAGLFNPNEGEAKVAEHCYKEEWASNEQGHAHVCNCGAQKDVATHTFGDYVYNEDASLTKAGTKTATCSVCGYKDTIADLDHPQLEQATKPSFAFESGKLVIQDTDTTLTLSYKIDNGEWVEGSEVSLSVVVGTHKVYAKATKTGLVDSEEISLDYEAKAVSLTVTKEAINKISWEAVALNVEVDGATQTGTEYTATKNGNVKVEAKAGIDAKNMILYVAESEVSKTVNLYVPIEGNLVNYTKTTPAIMYCAINKTNLPYPTGYGLYACQANGGYEICYADGSPRNAISGFFGATQFELTDATVQNWVVSAKVSGIARKDWGGFGITFAWYNGAPVTFIVNESNFSVALDCQEWAKSFDYPTDFEFTQTGKAYELEVEVKLGVATFKCDGVTLGTWDVSSYDLKAACGVAMKNYSSHTEDLCLKKIDVPHHTAKFYDGSTELTDSEMEIFEGKSYTLADGPEKDGYTFAGWFANPELTGNQVTSISATNNADVTLYAKYNEVPKAKNVANSAITGLLDTYAVIATDNKPYANTNGMKFGIVNGGIEYVSNDGTSKTTIPASNVAGYLPLTADVSSVTKWTVKASVTGLLHGNSTAGGFGVTFAYFVGKNSAGTADLMKPVSAILKDDNFLYVSYEGKIVGAKCKNANVTFSTTGTYTFEITVDNGVVSIKVNNYEMALVAGNGSLDMSSMSLVPAVGPTCNNYNAHFENFELLAIVPEKQATEMVDTTKLTDLGNAYAIMAAVNNNKPYPTGWGFRYSIVDSYYQFCDNSKADKALPNNYFLGTAVTLKEDISSYTEWTSSIKVVCEGKTKDNGGTDATYCAAGIVFGTIDGNPISATICQNGNLKISMTGNEYVKAVGAKADVPFDATGEYTFKVVVKAGSVTIFVNDVEYATQDLSSLTIAPAVGPAQHNMNAKFTDISLTVEK